MSTVPTRAVACAALLAASSVMADGTEALDTPSIPIASGTDVLMAGRGLVDGQPQSVDIDVPAGMTVEQVILYWEGQTSGEAGHGLTDNLTLNGSVDIIGDRIGGPTQLAGAYWTATYRADITGLGLVGVGANSVSISGMDFNQRNNGAGIVVIATDPASNAEIAIVDGNDFAFFDRPAPLDGTAPVTFTFDAAAVDRVAEMSMFVSSVALEDPSGAFGRPSVVRISVDNVVVIELVDQLFNSDGPEWDTLVQDVLIPAGATSVTAQIYSEDAGGDFAGNLPASLVWNATGLRMPMVDDGTGACCLPNGDCVVISASECAAEGGLYQGDDTGCSPAALGEPGTYRLGNHPDGNKAAPFYGLRLDELFDATGGHDVFTFDFEADGTAMYMTYDGETIHIYGTAFGGRDIGTSYDPNWSSEVEIDFTFTNVKSAWNDDDLRVKHETGAGTITWLATGEAIELTAYRGNKPFSFRFGDKKNDNGHRGYPGYSGWGWLTHGDNHVHASDWLFIAVDVCEDDTVKGACCVDDVCFEATEEHCEDCDGEYFGDGTDCDDVACVNEGACCFGLECVITTEWYCIACGGSYAGDGTTCADADCNECGSDSAGDCYEPHNTPFCNDEDCCNTVCAVDPFCCTVKWDCLCANEAEQMCGGNQPGCGNADAGECTEPNGTPYCNDEDCCSTVCAIDPYCCAVKWDCICADEASQLCDD